MTLALRTDWIAVECPRCGGSDAKRETDTMDTFVDSSWYFLRFLDCHNQEKMFEPDLVNPWMPVDLYVGGIEHAILHLLYARFITKFLHEEGLLSCDEPFLGLLTQGMVHGQTFRHPVTGRFLKPSELEDPSAVHPVEKASGMPVMVSAEKMSKSKHNGVDPQPVIEEFGADTVRLFMLFKAPPEGILEWDLRGIQGTYRWLGRVWSLVRNTVIARTSVSSQGTVPFAEDQNVTVAVRSAITHVTSSLGGSSSVPSWSFHVALAELMKLSNALGTCNDQVKAASDVFYHALRCLTLMLFPMAPHISSEIWRSLVSVARGARDTPWSGTTAQQDLSLQRWPVWDASSAPSIQQPLSKSVVITVNGKKRGLIEVPFAAGSKEIEQAALATDFMRRLLQTPRKGNKHTETLHRENPSNNKDNLSDSYETHHCEELTTSSNIRKVFLSSDERVMNFVLSLRTKEAADK